MCTGKRQLNGGYDCFLSILGIILQCCNMIGFLHFLYPGFQVFLSNTNNYMVSSNYFYLTSHFFLPYSYIAVNSEGRKERYKVGKRLKQTALSLDHCRFHKNIRFQ